ncbi:MAG: CvpA family protein [Alphaproteobacteria bacterium GM7ARS4]|nr:CvpA family protein [Alphaproteobacteria bacterium GM7ARS4]
MLSSYFVDFLIIMFVLISAIWGYLYGFLREISKLLSWVMAFIATYFAVPALVPIVGIEPVLVGYFVLVPVVFIFILVIVRLLSRVVEHVLSGDTLGFTNRMMGFVFGLARGFGVVCVAYLLLTIVPGIPGRNEPEIILSAKTRPLIMYGANMIKLTLLRQGLDMKDIEEGASKVLRAGEEEPR